MERPYINDTMSDDMTLVRDYAEHHSEQAFAALVSRYVNLVHSVALRQVRDPHLAEEVTQGVFILLARKASSLSPKTILAGWLCLTARHVSLDTLKILRRRFRREQLSHMQLPQNESDSSVWNELAPLLDEALHCLGQKEHDAVVLRFMDGKDLKQVGAAMGIGEDAARMRVNRGIEKLRLFFARKGVVLSAAALAGAVAANAVQAAPAGLAGATTAVAISGATITNAAVLTVTKTLVMTSFQKSVVVVAVALIGGAGIYEAYVAGQLHRQTVAMEQEQVAWTQQIQALQAERDAANSRLEALTENLADASTNNPEIRRLRNELEQLRQQNTKLSNDLARASNYWLSPEQTPPVISSSTAETAGNYARLIKKLATGSLSAAEELHLLKARPYLDNRYGEPDGFGYFQSEYLAALFNVKDADTKWELRRILEAAREEEHAHGLKWARMSEETLKKFPDVEADLPSIRDQWNKLNETTLQQINEVLSTASGSQSAVNWPVLDFDPQFKSGVQSTADDPRFKDMDNVEMFQSFNPDVYMNDSVIQSLQRK
jgi:RNA polymerase sigma factor (sigma-70 family)